MLEYQINVFRDKLEELIKCEASFQEIYSVSLILDELIVDFYAKILVNK